MVLREHGDRMWSARPAAPSRTRRHSRCPAAVSSVPLNATDPPPHIPYFDAPHIGALILTMLLPLVLVKWVKREESGELSRKTGWVLAGLLLANELGYRVFHFMQAESTREFLELSLPIHLCPLALFAGVIALWRRSQVSYEFAYFVGLTGTLNALLTPDIVRPFPSFGFIGYFVSHGGVLLTVMYATWALKMRPTRHSLWRIFLLLNAVLVVLALVNLALGGQANYAFLCGAPAADTPFFFAPWPWYIPILEGIALGMFVLAYLPFWFSDRLASQRARDKPD